MLSLALAGPSLACRAGTPPDAPVEAMHADVARRVALGDFEGLMQDAQRFQQSQERLPDGRWKLAIFSGGLRRGDASAAHGDQDWARCKTALAALAARHPGSSNAWLILASANESQAWAARGDGYANTVSDPAHARFLELLEASRQVLYRRPALLASNPQWYALRLSVGGAAGDGPAELDAVFAQALRRAPSYRQAWFARLNDLTPK